MNRTPLGIYHAVSCQDATSLSYDGQPYYEVNMLPRAGVPDECEILFADGSGFLLRPTRISHPSRQLSSEDLRSPSSRSAQIHRHTPRS